MHTAPTRKEPPASSSHEATNQHSTGKEAPPNVTPHKQNIPPAVPLTENQQLAPLPPEAQWHRQRSAVTLPKKQRHFTKAAK